MTKGPVESREGHHPQLPVPRAPNYLCSILAAAIGRLEAASVTYCLPPKSHLRRHRLDRCASGPFMASTHRSLTFKK